MRWPILILLLPTLVSAVNVGISPPRIDASRLMQGSHFETQFTLSKSDGIFNFSIGCETGCEWVSFKPGAGILGTATRIKAIIDVPADAPMEQTTCKCKALLLPGRGSGMMTAIELPLEIRMNVSDMPIKDCRIISAHLNARANELQLSADILNSGNLPCTAANGEIRVPSGEIILLESEETVRPFSRMNATMTAGHSLPPGRHRADLTFKDAGFEETVDIDVPSGSYFSKLAALWAALMGAG